MTAADGHKKRWPRVAAGVLIGTICLWLAFRGFELADFTRALRSLNVPLTLLALGSTFLTLLMGAWRWRWLFYPHHQERSFHALFRALVVGQMVNIVSPLRVGEVARVYALAEHERLTKTHVLATVALEKVLDLFVFGVAIALLLMLMALPGGVRVKTSAQLGVAAAALLTLWFVARFAVPIANRLDPFTRWLPTRLRVAARAALHRVVEGLATLRKPQMGAFVLGLSVLLQICSALTNYLLIRAFGFDIPAWSALFLLVLLQVGSVPPSLPGKIGVFNYLVVVGLAVFGIDQTPAFSFSLVLYVVALLPKVLIGSAYVASGSVHVTRRAPA